MANQPTNQVKIFNPDGSVEVADPSEFQPIPQASAIRSLGDTLLKFGRGATSATKALTDTAGANNIVSRGLDNVTDFISSGLSDEAVMNDQIAAKRLQDTQDAGIGAQLKAVGKNFLDNPLDTLAEGAGSIVPTAAAMIASKGRVNPANTGAAMGVAQGMGAVKGSIYADTKAEALNLGYSEQEAEQLAQDAQAYTGQNSDQIALGGALGYLAGKTGAESSSILTGATKDNATDLLRNTLKGFATEAGTEGLQGGQEQVAANLALQRDGADVEIDRGVAGQAASEAIAGGLTGGAFGAADTFMTQPEPTPQPKPNPREQLRNTLLAQNPSGAITQAAATAAATGAADNAILGLPLYAGEPLVTFPDGTTMTRAEAQQRYSAEELAAFEARVGTKQPSQGVADNVSDTTEQPITDMATGTGGLEPANDAGSAGNPVTQSSDIGTNGNNAATPTPSIGGDMATGTASGNADSAVKTFANAQEGDIVETGGVKFRKVGNGFERVVEDNNTIDEPLGNSEQLPNELPSNPRQLVGNSDIDQKANEAATSPLNDLPEPTQAQKDAGNYKVGRIKVGGLDISVENPDQSTRSGVDRDGNAWQSTMNGHYGYIKGVKARSPDKEHVDVNVKPSTPEDFAGDVYVINQKDPKTGKFDEPKVYIGYTSQAEAKNAYQMNYATGWQGFDSITQVPMAKFKEMLNDEQAFMKPVKPTLREQIAERKAAKEDYGLANENAPFAKEQLQQTFDNSPDIGEVDKDGNLSFTPPDWNELPNGFAFREYRVGKTAYQEVRAPKTGNVEPAVMRRELNTETGKTAGALEATGTLDNIMSGQAFEVFNEYFGKKTEQVPALPTNNKPQQKITDEEVEGLFGLPAKREKALKRIAEGRGWFGAQDKAKEFVRLNGLSDTHEVIKGSGLRWEIVEKQAAPNLGSKKAGDILNIDGDMYRIEGAGDRAGNIKLTKNPNMLSERTVYVDQNTFNNYVKRDDEYRAEIAGSNNNQSKNIIQQAKDIGKLQIIPVTDKPKQKTELEELKDLRANLSEQLQAQGTVTDARLEDRLAQVNRTIQEIENKQAEPVNDEKAKAKADFDSALGDLGDIFGKNLRSNITPEQEQKLIPVLTRLFDAAFRLGYQEFKQAAKFVLNTIRDKIGKEAADTVTIDHLQGAYIAMAGKYGTNATSKRDVIAVESKQEIDSNENTLSNADNYVKNEPTPTNEVNNDGNSRQAKATGTNGNRPLERASTQDALINETSRNAEPSGIGSGTENTRRTSDTDRKRNTARSGLGDGEGAIPVSSRRTGRKPRSAEQSVLFDEPTNEQANERTLEVQKSRESKPSASNYKITDLTKLGEGGQKTKYRNNIAAIKLLNELQASGRQATAEEQDVLARYVGWGGIPQAFDESNKDWSNEYAELKALLSNDEWESANESTQYAHYTSQEIINSIYNAIKRFGFSGGNVLEPGSGVGNFMGLLPDSLRSSTRFTAVERERIAGGIAKLLYPNNNVQLEDFRKFNAQDGYFDLVIGNPPFSSTSLTDLTGRKHLSGLSIHNYFFAKSIDMLREGGVLGMVVSNSFMDAKNDRARRYIGERAELVGAIRLPNNAFAKNANTEVTTDIIFIKKRPESDWVSKAAKEDMQKWLGVGFVDDPKGGDPIPLNQYFIDNPSMMLGKMERAGSMYGPDQPALIASEGQNTAQLLEQAVNNLPAGIYQSAVVENSQNMQDALIEKLSDVYQNGVYVDVGGHYVSGDKLYVRMPDVAGEGRTVQLTPFTKISEKKTLGKSGLERIKALAKMRVTLRSLLAAELRDDKNMEVLRKQLNSEYDDFVKQFGYINQRGTVQLFGDDPDFPLLASLEMGYDAGIGEAAAERQGISPQAPSAKKAAIFKQRVIPKYEEVTKAETPEDALFVSIAERGQIDSAYIGKLLNADGEEVLKELANKENPTVFVDPATGGYVLKDAYLSGNVRKKMEQAKAAGMFKNVGALERVIPEDIPAHEISGKIGAPWIPTETYEDFAQLILGEGTTASITYVPALSSYIAKLKAGSEVANTNTYGTKRMGADAIFSALLNSKEIKVGHYEDSPTGKPKFVLEKEPTDEANDKAREIKDKFNDWLFSDPERAEKLQRSYNDAVNNYVTRVFDGAMLKFAGKVPDFIIKLRRHQRNAVARIIQDGRALLDHVVGAGKTFTVIAAAMELKRTGLAKKPMIVVPNHLVKQWASDFYRLYPAANILTATKKDFQRENRRKFLAKIATGNWDAVIIAHSSFGFIKPDSDFEMRFNKERIDEIIEAIKSLKDENDQVSKRTVKQLAKMKESLENKLASLRDKPMDDLLDFGQIGVDQLFVDEAHLFKNLMYVTKMQNVRGLGQAKGSQRAYDMFIKTHQLYDSNKNGRGVVFATGTPVSNSLAEMYHMLRYLAPETLKDSGQFTFDAWAKTFADVEQVWMQSMSGDGYKASNRMSVFANTPELLKVFDQVADTVTIDDIKQAYAEENNGKEFPIPPLKGGRRLPVSISLSAEQKDYMNEIAQRAKELEQRKGKPQKGDDNMLSIMGDARKAAMDIRMVRPNMTQRDPNGRIAIAARNVYDRYVKYNNVLGTQLVFSDMGTPKKSAEKELKEYNELMAEIAPLNDERIVAMAELGDESALEKIEKAEDAQRRLDEKGRDWADSIQMAMRGFSIYDDMKDALIELGIPENEIAFIHDYNTDDQKAALFRAVNDGKIRVLLGSTEKMGAGTNVQERVVALHHLDVPWKPSDIEQREGRVIRQGNSLINPDNPNFIQGFEVEVLAYATQDTLDLFMWQTQEKKLSMIGQLRTGNVGREVDNAFEEMQMSAGEMQAAATSNPYLLEEIQLKDRIKKLERQKRSFDGQKNDLINRLNKAKKETENLPEQIKKAQKIEAEAIKAMDNMREYFKGLQATVNGQTINGNSEIRAALRDAISASPQIEKYGKTKLDINIEFNGKNYTSESAISDAVNKTLGDASETFITLTDGRTIARGSEFASEVFESVNNIPDGKFLTVGTIGEFDLDVYRTGDMFDVVISLRGDSIADMWLTNDIERLMNALRGLPVVARNAINQQRGLTDYLESKLESAKRTKSEIEAMPAASDWDGEADLQKAREKYKEVLKKLAEREAEKPADDTAFSRVENMGGMPLAEVQSIVNGIKAQWKNAPPIFVVENMQDELIPESVRKFDAQLKAQGSTGDPAAFISGGKVYILSSMMPNKEFVYEALFHETLGHFGLRGTFGSELGTILDQIALLRSKDVIAKAKEYGFDTKSKADLRRAAEEVLAEMAQTRPEIGFVKRAIAAIRKFLRDIGFDIALSDNDIIANYLLPARRFVESGGNMTGVNAFATAYRKTTAFARTNQTETPEFKRWFGDSKVVDAEGKPLVVYHGTTADFQVFDLSRAGEVGENFGSGAFFTSDPGVAASYTARWMRDPEFVSAREAEDNALSAWGKAVVDYGKGSAEAAKAEVTKDAAAAIRRKIADQIDGMNRPITGAQTVPVYIAMKNPLVVDAKGEYYFRVYKTAFQQAADGNHDGIIFRNVIDSANVANQRPSDVFVAFRPNQIKSATGNNGQFDANNDDIMFMRTPQSVVSDMVAKAAMNSPVLDKAITAISEPSAKSFGLGSNIRTQLDKARQDPKGFGKMFDAAMRFETDARLIAARPAEMAPSIIAPSAESIREAASQIRYGDTAMKDKEFVSSLLFEGTLYGGSVLEGKVFSSDELRAKGATDKQIKMYYEARASVDASLDETAASVAYNMARAYMPFVKDKLRDNPANAKNVIREALNEQYDAMKARFKAKIDAGTATRETILSDRAEIEKLHEMIDDVKAMFEHVENLQRAGYMPLSRFGKYSVTAFNDSGTVAEFMRFETEAEAKIKQKELAKQYKRVERGVMPTNPSNLFAGADPETVALFVDKVREIDGININDAVFQEWYRSAVSDRSALKRMLERKGTAGFDTDLEKVLASFLTSNARFAANNYNRGDMLDVLQYLQTDPNYKRKGDVYDEAKQLFDYVQNPADPFTVGRSLMFTWFMGGSIASAAVNMTQPLTMTLPWLNQYVSVTKAAKALKQASSLAGAISFRDKVPEGELGKALLRAREIGLVDPQETHHLYKLGSGGIINRLTLAKDLRTRLTGVATAWGFMFGKAEQFNRYLTFITAWNLAKENNLGNAFEFARRAVEETQGIYSKSNRPNWARGTGSLGAVGAAAFTFKQYSIAYVEMLARMARSGSQGRRAAMLQLGVLFLLAGAMGLPFADDEADILDTMIQFAGGEGNTRRHLREYAFNVLGEDLGMFALYGVTAMMPIDIQGRMGMGNLLPSTALLMPSNSENRGRSALEVFGASGSLVSDSLDAVQGLENGKDFVDVIKQFAPVAVKNVFKGADMLEDGFYADTRGRRVIDTTDSDAFWKSIGFQPINVSKAQKQVQGNQQSIARTKQRESAIADLFAKARFENDPAKAQKAREMLEEWNEAHPDLPIVITPRQVLNRVRAMAMTREERQMRATPRELRGTLL